MKHKKLKEKIYGRGKKKKKPPPPPPPKLKPPYLGDYWDLATYSVGHIVDLISDGPILGLVNRFGAVLRPSDIMQGIYLNDVPIQESSMLGYVGLGSSYPILSKGLESHYKNIYEQSKIKTSNGFGVDDRLVSMQADAMSQKYENFYRPKNKKKQPIFTNVFYDIAQSIQKSKLKDPSERGLTYPHYAELHKVLFAKFIEQPDESENSNIYKTNTFPIDFELQDHDFDKIAPDENFGFNAPVYILKTKDKGLHINLSFTPQHKNSLMIEGSSFYKGIKDIEKTLQYQNKKEKSILKDILFSSIDVVLDDDNNDIMKLLQGILCDIYNDGEGLNDIIGGTEDYISPYICFAYTGVIEGFDKKTHQNIFNDIKDDDQIIFALHSESNKVDEINPRNFKSLLYPSLDQHGKWNGMVKGFYYIKLKDENLSKTIKEKNKSSLFYIEMVYDDVVEFLKNNLRLVVSKNGLEL